MNVSAIMKAREKSERERDWRIKNPEASRRIQRKASKKFKEANIDQIRIINSMYRHLCRLDDPEKAKADQRSQRENRNRGQNARRALDPEPSRAAFREWKLANPGYWREYRKTHRPQLQAKDAKRRAMRREAVIGDQTMVRKIYVRAAELRQWFDVVVDHIIPLCRKGAHSAENLQIIYKSENLSKGSRLDYTPRVVFT